VARLADISFDQMAAFLESALLRRFIASASAHREVVTGSSTSIAGITDMLCDERSTFC
jgi:hypothetical protein